MSVTVRQYVEADHDAVVQLYLDGMDSYSFNGEDEVSKALWEQVRKESLEGDLSDIKGHYMASGGGNYWVAVVSVDDKQDEIVGMVALQPQGDGVGVLRRMSVKEGFRRQGLGRKLVLYLESWAKANGFRRVTLATGLSMTRAVAFYQAAGYTLTHTSIFSQELGHLTAHFSKTL